MSLQSCPTSVSSSRAGLVRALSKTPALVTTTWGDLAASPRLLALSTSSAEVYVVDLARESLGPILELLDGKTLVGLNMRPLLALLLDVHVDARDLALEQQLLETSGVTATTVVPQPDPRLRWGGLIGGPHLRAVQTAHRGLHELALELTQKGAAMGLDQVVALEHAVLPHMVRLEEVGIGVDEDRWNELLMELHRDRAPYERMLTMAFGPTAWRRPETLKACLEQRLGFPNLTGTGRSKLLPYAVDRAVVALMELRSVDAFLDQLGWPIHEHLQGGDGRLRPRFNQLGTCTGRITASSPGILSVPRHDRIRACFRPAPGHRFVVADYAAAQMRVLAAVTRCPRLINRLLRCHDLHVSTAAHLLGIPSSAVGRSERAAAKAINFGITMGMGAESLSTFAREKFDVEMTVGEAEALVDKFFFTHDGVRRWRDAMHASAPSSVSTPLGRRKAFGPADSPGQRIAAILQGTEADAMKLSMIHLHHRLRGSGSRLVLVAYDEQVWEVPIEHSLDVADTVGGEMNRAMYQYIRPVPTEVKVSIRTSWADSGVVQSQLMRM